MKDKIMYLIIGVLIGAVITAGGFLIFGQNSNNPGQMGDRGEMKQMDGNMTPPDGSNMTKPDGAPNTNSVTQTTNSTSNT